MDREQDDDAIELVIDAHATIGESPLWSAGERALYWMDIKAPELRRLDEETGEERRWPLPDEVGAFALLADPPGALVALRHGLARLDFASGAVTMLADAPFDPALFRFNEGACDPGGRFFVGVMFDPLSGDPPPGRSALHSFTLADGLRPEPDAAELHNGMAWSADGASFYLSHSFSGAIWRFAYDDRAGHLGARSRFAEIPSEIGIPDGAAIDVEGCYWCAIHGGWRLRRYRPDGSVDRDVMLPVSQPTMCAFGGDDLATLYVTSAAEKLSPAALEREPHAGGLFRFRPGVAGIPRRAFVR